MERRSRAARVQRTAWMPLESLQRLDELRSVLTQPGKRDPEILGGPNPSHAGCGGLRANQEIWSLAPQVIEHETEFFPSGFLGVRSDVEQEQ